MDSHMNINMFLKTARDLILSLYNTFDKSEYCPATNDIANMTKELLSNLMADSSKVNFKWTFAGSIVEVKEYEKKQSFCSDFVQMIKNIVGLLGFELSKFLMVHMGMFKMIANIIDDIDAKASTYEELLHYVSIIHNLMKSVPKSNYQFIQNGQSNPRQINGLVLVEDGVSSFFDNQFAIINSYIQSKNISQFDKHKTETITALNEFIDSIIQVTLTIESPIDLVIMNMGEYGAVYNGSFIKLFEILYKAVHADNPRFNDKSINHIIQFTLVETVMDTEIGLTDKTSAYYIKYLEEYYNNVYRMTYRALFDDERLTSYLSKVQLVMTNAMAKITLCMLTRLVLILNWNRVTLLLTSTPSRIQFFQVLQAFLCLPPGIDFTYNMEQLFVICYILTSDSSAKATKIASKKRSKKE